MVLCDQNTAHYCLPALQEIIREKGLVWNVFVMNAGEEFKTLHQSQEMIQFLLQTGATRNTVLINLGGGTVCDLGGFVASVYKRGIPFLNLPTTLIAQADAAIGGKTGVNHLTIKNLIGTFHAPMAVGIFPQFLQTLPQQHWKSGLGELFKYAMIGADISLQAISALQPNNTQPLTGVIQEAVRFKTAIVDADPFEKGPRKVLNFGHTVGHAIESLALENNLGITHGEAVAAGVVAETYLSVEALDLNSSVLNKVSEFFLQHFSIQPELTEDPARLLQLMLHDKKNRSHDAIQPVLLSQNGEPRVNETVSQELITRSLVFLHELIQKRGG